MTNRFAGVLRLRRLGRTLTLALLLVLPVALVGACKNKKDGEGERVGVSPSPPPLDLDPLPDAPEIQVNPEDLPGADGSLAVVVARPQGPTYGNFRPTITFNKPVAPLGSIANEKTLAQPATIVPALEGEWKWLGSASVEFVPKGPVPYSTDFKITVNKELAALDGSTQKDLYEWEFQTPKPRMQDADPHDTFRWLVPDQEFTILFDQPVKDLGEHAKLLLGGNKTVALRVTQEVNIAEERRAQAEGRNYEPMSYEDRGFKNKQTRYHLKPASKLPLDSDVALTISGKIRGKDGPLTMGNDVQRSYRTYEPFRFKEARACTYSWKCPYGPIVLHTTNRLKNDEKGVAETLKDRLKITPEPEIDWDNVGTYYWQDGYTYEGAYVVLPGKYKPGTTYTVEVKTGVQDEFGQSAPAFKGTVTTDDLDPRVDPGSNYALLENTGDGSLPVESVNVKSAQAEVWEVTPAEAAKVMKRMWGNKAYWPPRSPRRVQLNLAGKRNEVKWTPLELARGDKKSGLFLTRIRAPEVNPKYPPTWRIFAQVTDIAVHAKLGATKSAAWVTTLSDGKPLGGADVVLYGETGNKLFTGKTDADGLIELPAMAELFKDSSSWSPGYVLIAASKNGDTGVTLSEWRDGLDPWSFDLYSAWEGNRPNSLGTVFAERGIYRPGDEVYIKGIVRYRKLGELKRPASDSVVQLHVEDSRGDEVLDEKVQISKFGTFDAKIDLGKDVPLGSYWISATGKMGKDSVSWSGSFRVEEYRPPQFRVDVTPVDDNVIAGDPLTAKVAARYLFGGAMASSDVRWSVVRSSDWYEPPGNEGFAFGNQTWWWDDYDPEPSEDVFASGDGVTDQQGNFEISPGIAVAPGDKTWTYTMEAEVADVNRQRIANRTTVRVHPAAVYVGVKQAATGFAKENEPVELQMVAATPEGDRVSGADLTLIVKRREWKSIRKKGVGGRWSTVSEPVETDVHTCEEKSKKTPVSCTFTPEAPGLYIMEASVTDDEKRQQTSRSSFYVTGSGWVSWQRNDTDRIDLVSDKQLYDVGDTAKVLVKSPYPKAEAVLSIEREGVLETQQITLDGSATTLEIPITEDMVPNTFVGLVIARGRVSEKDGIESGDDPGRPAVRVGYTELKVEKKSKRLDVALDTGKDTFRPRDEVTVNIQVNDYKGNGVGDTEVTLWAVDEGVLRLTAYEAPDPVEVMHPQRGLSTRMAEGLIHLVYRRTYSEKGYDDGGGGGGEGAEGPGGIRSNFKTTAVFLPGLVTDASGKAQAKFSLPDNLTTFRIMAVAVTPGDRFGVKSKEIAVAKPLLALPALPRFTRVGDEFEAGVVVHANDKKISKAKVQVFAEGVTLDDSESKTARFINGKPQEVRFNFRAESPGIATFRFKVTGEGESDAVEQKIPVHLPVGIETVAVYGDTKDERVEGLVPPEAIMSGVGGMEVSMSSTILGGFDENMRQLVDYPYGCLEQMSSRLVPFVAIREIYGKFNVPYEGPSDQSVDWEANSGPVREFITRWIDEDALLTHGTTDPDEVVATTVKKIESLQNFDGGFKYWSTGSCSATFSSVYAVLALHRADEVGYDVDDDVMKKGKKFLTDTILPGKSIRCGWYNYTASDVDRAFAVYTLARMGDPKPSYYGQLYKNRKKLPLFSQAMLADAMYVGKGNRAQAKQLMTEILNHAKESPSGVHFEENDELSYAQVFSSDTRTTAIVMQTLTTVSPDHPYVAKIGRYLTTVRKGNGRFRNTQEAAFALMGLVDVVRTKEKADPNFKAVVTLGDDELVTEKFKGRSMDIKTKNVPIDDITALGKQVPFKFKTDGDGVLYYSARLRYAPQEVPMDELDRGMVVQRWFEPFNGGGQSRRFYAGDLIRVRVRIASHMERNYVAVDVPLPAGVEPIDTTLATSAQLPSSNDSEGYQDGYDNEGYEDYGYEVDDYGYADDVSTRYNPWLFSFWSPFNHTEKRDDRVVLFADTLPPGVHVADFVVRATTPGEFMLKPAHAEEMYTPEVFGRSSGGTFRVIDTTEVSSR